MKTTWFLTQINFQTKCFNKPFPDFYFNDNATENVTAEKILGIDIDNIDNKRNFKPYSKNLCKKTNQKSRRFYRKRNNNKVESIKKERIVITHLFP